MHWYGPTLMMEGTHVSQDIDFWRWNQSCNLPSNTHFRIQNFGMACGLFMCQTKLRIWCGVLVVMLCQQKQTWCEWQSLMTLFVTATMKLMKLLCMPSGCVRKSTLSGLILSCGFVGGRYIFFASKSYYPRWLSSKTMSNSLPWLREWFRNKEIRSDLTKQLATSTKSPNSPRRC